MPIATITSKGQVTIPAGIRAQCRLQEGTRVDFRAEEDGTVRLVPMTKAIGDVAGILWRPGVRSIPAGEMRPLAGEAIAADWKPRAGGRARP
jgi:antitoxin PrlF